MAVTAPPYYVVTDEGANFKTIFEIAAQKNSSLADAVGRHRDTVINDPDIPDYPAKWVLSYDSIDDPRDIIPFITREGAGIFAAVLIGGPIHVAEFQNFDLSQYSFWDQDSQLSVYRLGPSGVLLDPGFDDVIDLRVVSVTLPLRLGAGKDYVLGSGANEKILGGKGHDHILAGSGRDTLLGGAGNDRLLGQKGNDTLNGGSGNDLLIGGGGRDQFIFANKSGNDRIKDFNARNNKEDIDLKAVTDITGFRDMVNNHMSTSGGDVIIDDGKGTVITLQDVTLSDLGKGDFIF